MATVPILLLVAFLTDFDKLNKILYQPLAEIDPEVKNIIDKETWRQFTGLELIALKVRI